MPLPVITVCQDTNEQTPLLFPETMEWWLPGNKRGFYDLQVEKVSLRKWGYDYCVRGHEDCTGVEAKRTLRELRTNLFSRDRFRSGRSFQRLSESCRHPYLLLDMSLSESLRECRYFDESPSEIYDRLFEKLGRLGINLLWLPSPTSTQGRKGLGEMVVRRMLGHIRAEEQLIQIVEAKALLEGKSPHDRTPTG